MFMMRMFAPAVSALMFLTSAAGASVGRRSDDLSARGAVRADSLRAAISARLGKGGRSLGASTDQWRHVRTLYAAHRGRALWFGKQNGGKRVAAVVNAITNASDEALRLDGYPMAQLREALAALRGVRVPGATDLAEADVTLTYAFAAYAEDLLTGQIDPRSTSQSWHIDPQEEDVDSALVRVLRAASLDRALTQLRPQTPQYEELRGALERYRRLVAAGGWPRVPVGPVLSPGDTSTVARLDAIAVRLRAEGFIDGEIRIVPLPVIVATAPGAERAIYDARLAGAIASFQERHGLVADSIVGPNTRAALDMPADFRLRQIAANLERHRWLPRTLGQRYIVVNVPSFQLRAFDGGAEALQMKVIVGAEYQNRATPVFSDSVSYVVFRPYWNVPDGIAAREIFPLARRDRSFLSRNGYEVVRSNDGTHVRQTPGPGNALGLVKFMFPNEFNIYLHDTPIPELFREQVRAMSHGCIRVEKPAELAAFVLGSQGWDAERIRAAMDSGADDHRVNLERKVPVYIVYFTTYLRDGVLYFGNDLYDRDQALVRAVAGAALPTDDVEREAQALRALVPDLAGR